jgi:hypothetical protein
MRANDLYLNANAMPARKGIINVDIIGPARKGIINVDIIGPRKGKA